jgi:NADPH:quinone reductase-like Zn-dependent oxidoreductase
MTNQSMQAFTFKRYGKSPDVGLATTGRPAALKANEILVQVHAAALNPIDNMILTGMFKPVLHFQLPATIGSDLAGVVIEVGSGVTRFKPGDAVFASIFDTGTGAVAEYALTSWQALKERAGIQPGQKVFIPAGSGGIGTFAIQLAKYFGAKVATTTSTKNLAFVKSLGADQVIDYTKQEFDKVLLGYDMVLGTIKGNDIEKSTGILKPGGKIVSLVGPLDKAFAKARKLNFVLKFVFGLMSRKIITEAKKRQVSYSFLFVRPDGNQLSDIGTLLEAEKIKPVIDKVFSFEQAKDALAYLAQGRAKGKVVIKII